MANALTYIKNVGKSIGYASVDVFKEKNPVFSDFAETNGELVNDMYKSVKNLKKNIKDLPNKIMESEVGEFGKTYFDNLMSDLKSGKFYNKERISEYESDAAGSMLGDMDLSVFDDFGGGGDDLNFGDLDDDRSISSNEMMDIVGEKSSLAVSTAVARSAEYIVKANSQTSKAMYNQMNAIYGRIHTGMSTINQNISKILEFSNENMNLHFENSKTFYTEMTRMNQEQNNYLKEISEALKNMNEPAKSSKSSRTRFSDLVSGDGVLDLAKYGEHLKKNLKENSSGIYDMFEMLTSVGGLKQLAASPLDVLAKGLVETVIPKALEKSMENLNKSLSGIIANAFMSMREKASDLDSGGGIWSVLSEILGVDTELRTTLDPSRYEKGRVPFDGVTRKAIIEVIPTYLSKILTAISGQKRETFDYDSGKFVTLDDLEKRIKSRTKSSAESAARELTEDYRKERDSDRYKHLTKAQKEALDKDWETLIFNLYNEEKRFDTRSRKVSAADYGIDEESFKLFREMMDGKSSNVAYGNRMLRERSDQTRWMEDLQGNATLTAKFNDSEKNTGVGLSSIFSNANNAVVEKLQEIHKELAYIRLYGTGGSGSGVGNIIGNTSNAPDFDTFETPTTKSVVEKANDASDNKKEESDDSEEDPEKEKKKTTLEEAIKNTEIAKKAKKTLSEKIEALRKSGLGIIQGPMNLAASIIDKVDARIYELVYGPVGGREEDDDRTLKEILFDKIQEQMDNFSTFIDEKIVTPLTTRTFKDNAHDAAKKFLSIFGIDLDKSIEGIKKFIFGEDEDGNRTKGGFLGKFVKDFRDTFRSIGNWFKEGVTEAADEAGVTSKMNEQGKKKQEENDQLDRIRNAFKNNMAETEDNKSGQFAEGAKRISKTGLAVVSEGEMIIPPDMNPFNIAKRYRDEKKVKTNLKKEIDNIFQYGEGTDNATSGKKLSKETQNAIKERIIENTLNRISSMPEDQALAEIEKLKKKYPDAAKSISNFIDSKYKRYDASDYEEGRNPFINRILEELGGAVSAIRKSVDENFEITDDDKKKFSKNASNFLGGIKEYGGTMAAGATVGAGVSLLTGMIGGPLLGAAAGAGVALIQRSDTVRNWLFGEEDGKPGVLPKNISESIQKFVPDMAKSGALGGLLAMLPGIPGGPVAGLILGSSIGFVKNSEAAQKAIFGEGKFLGTKEDFQKKVKSVLPKMGAGALAGALFGPFGIGTNILLGSAIGFASDTDKFKDLMFGEVGEDGKRIGGLLQDVTKPMAKFFKDLTEEFKGFIKDEIIAPLKDSVDPFKKQLEIMAKTTTDLISGFIKNTIVVPLGKTIKAKILDPLGKTFSFLFKPAKDIFKGLVSLPFKGIGAAGDALRRHQIKAGTADYMSAEERVAYRDSKGWRMKWGDPRDDIYHKLDKSMIGKDSDSLDAAEAALSGIASAQRDIKDIRNDAYKNVSKALRPRSIDYDTSRAVKKMIENGRYEDAINFVNKSNITDPKVKQNLLDTIMKESSKIQTSLDMKKDSKGTMTSIAKTLRDSLGFELDDKTIERLSKNPKEAEKLLKYIKSEQEYRKTHDVSESETVEEKKTDEFRDTVTEGIEKITKLLERLNGDSESTSGQSNINSSVNQDKINAYQDKYNEIIDSDEEYEKLSLEEKLKRRYELKGPIRATLGLGRNLARNTVKKGFKIAKAPIKFGSKAFKFASNEALGMYDALRDTPFMTNMWGDRSVDWHNPEDRKEVKRHDSKILNWFSERRNRTTDETLPAVIGQEQPSLGYRLFGEMSSNIAKLTGFTLLKEGVDPNKVNDTKATSKGIFSKIKSAFKGIKKKVTQFIDGHQLTFIKDQNGDLDLDTSSAPNKAYLEEKQEEKETQRGILAGLTSMPSMFGGLFSNLFGKKDDNEGKESIFDKILNFFTGKGSSGISLLSVLKSAIPLALGAAAVSGVFDNIANRISGGLFGKKDANKGKTVTDDNGNEVEIKTDKNGNPILDENGNYETLDGKTISGDKNIHSTGSIATMSLSERLKYNLARGIATGKESIIGEIIKENVVYKAISHTASTLVKAANDAGAMDNVINGLLNATQTFINTLKKVPLLGKHINEERLLNLGVAIGDMIEKNLPKAGPALKKISSSLTKLALPIAIVTAISDFTTGWQDASTILKIKAEHVTLPQKIICGLVRTFKNLIPVVGTFIPDRVITDLFINHVSKWFGIDTSEIKKQQDEAQAELDKYNAEHPDADYDWEEYNKKINKQYTWTEKVGNFISDTFKNKKASTYTSSASTYTTGNNVNTSSTYATAVAMGSGLYGRGSGEDHVIEKPSDFISQVDPKYKNKRFNVAGDTQKQTLGDSGCAPAAAAMAINATNGTGTASMEETSRNALKYKVKNDGVSASYFSDEFSRHGLRANYTESSVDIANQLRNNNKVVLMGQDSSNMSKANSPFGPNPHYVVANGMSMDGKYIYINDPESRTPNMKYSASKVLGSSKLGIAAARGTRLIANKFKKYVARGSYGPETIQYKVWNALRAAGYSEITTAATMGNIQAESGFRPEAIEKGSGAGFGLVQWTAGRRTAFENYAAQQGVSASDLAVQINYLLKELQANSGIWTKASSKYGLGSLSRNDWANGTDLVKATQAFMCCFERPSYDPNTNHIDRRIQYANEYLQEFTGTSVDVSTSYTSTSTATTSDTGESGGFLGKIFSAFGKLASAYKLTDSMYDNTSSSETGTDSEVISTPTVGNTVSNAEKAKLQTALVDKMKSVQGKLKYAQGNAKYPGSRNPEDGSGDCSSTVQWAYKNILGIDPGSWTGAQRENSNTYTVATNTKDESKLQLGDLLLKDGHVEMYAGNNTMIGHGGGNDGKKLGPTIKQLDQTGKYDLVRRWVGFKGSGSGLAYNNALHYIASGSEKPQTIPFGIEEHEPKDYSGNTNVSMSSTMPSYSRNTTQTNKSEGASIDTIVTLVGAIIELLKQVVTNTDTLNNIVKLLGDYIEAAENEAKGTAQAAVARGSSKSNVSSALAKQNLINAMRSSVPSNGPNAQLQRLIEATERIARQ